jgi:hypothetical protein
MIALPTTTASVLRGTATSAFGDDVDSDAVVQVGVPLAVMVASQASTRSADSRPQEVEFFRGRVPAGTDIRVNDKLRDERDVTQVYLVTGSHSSPNPIISMDVALDLTRTPTT